MNLFLLFSLLLTLPLVACKDKGSDGSNDVKIYIINLDSSKERWLTIGKQMIESGTDYQREDDTNYTMKYTRFSATDGYEMVINKINDEENFSGKDIKNEKVKFLDKVDYEVNCDKQTKLFYQASLEILAPYVRRAKPLMTVGELGLSCSELRLFKAIANQKNKYALMLEDDAIITLDFRRRIDIIIDNLPKEEWDIIYLGYTTWSLAPNATQELLNSRPNIRKNKLHEYNEYLYKISNDNRYNILGTFAILVNKESIANKINLFETVSVPTDLHLSKLIANNQIKAFAVKDRDRFGIRPDMEVESTIQRLE